VEQRCAPALRSSSRGVAARRVLFRRMTDEPQDQPTQAASAQSAWNPPVAMIGSHETLSPKPSWWKRTVSLPVWSLVVVGVLFLGAIGVATSGKNDADKAIAPATETTGPDETDESAQTVEAASDTTESPATDAPTTTEREVTTTIEQVTTTTEQAIGTRENPIPLGIGVPAGDWTYTVVAFEGGNIDALLNDINQFNDPPPVGKITVRVRYRLQFAGSGAGDARFVDINLVGATGTTYGPYQYACCPPETDELIDQPETFSGGQVEGWVYYQITPEDAMGKLLAFDPNIEYTDVPGGVGFFQIN